MAIDQNWNWCKRLLLQWWRWTPRLTLNLINVSKGWQPWRWWFCTEEIYLFLYIISYQTVKSSYQVANKLHQIPSSLDQQHEPSTIQESHGWWWRRRSSFLNQPAIDSRRPHAERTVWGYAGTLIHIHEWNRAKVVYYTHLKTSNGDHTGGECVIVRPCQNSSLSMAPCWAGISSEYWYTCTSATRAQSSISENTHIHTHTHLLREQSANSYHAIIRHFENEFAIAMPILHHIPRLQSTSVMC